MLASLFLVQIVGAYGFSGPRYQYAWFVFAFTTAIVLGSAMTENGCGRDDCLPARNDGWDRAAHRLRRRHAALAGAHRSGSAREAWPLARGPSGPRCARPSIRARRNRAMLPRTQRVRRAHLPANSDKIAAARAEIGMTGARAEILQNTAILLEAAASRARSLRVANSAPKTGCPTELQQFARPGATGVREPARSRVGRNRRGARSAARAHAVHG